MKYSYSISWLLALITIVAAYFAGRMPLLELANESERQAMLAQDMLAEYERQAEISIGNQYFDWHSLKSSLVNGPEWDDKNESPPISLMAALEICREFESNANSVKSETNVDKWSLESITLAPMPVNFPYKGFQADRWMYLIEFQGLKDGGSAYEDLSGVIFMDGTAMVVRGEYSECLEKFYDTL
jgi:hypothetical protein